MTAGNPTKIILDFTFPIFIGNVFQQFYNMADTVIVGKFVGTKALAAVGSTGTIMFLILGFVLGMTAGFTVLTAQKFGAGDMKAMRQTVGGAAVLSILVTIVLTAGSMLFMKPLLRFMHTPSDIFDDAYSYIMIICAGIAAQMLYNLLASVLRALGNSKVPLYFLILSALLNIVLDLVLIIVFHLGAPGAAYATVISQGVSGVLCLVYIVKKIPVLHLERDDWKPKAHLLKIQLGIGIPMALQYSITAIGTMMVQTSLNLLGSGLVAAFTAASKIEQVVTQAYVALGTTMATYCAQNIGAGKIERVKDGYKANMFMVVVFSGIITLIIFLFGYFDHDRRKIYDVSVCIGRCGRDHGFGRYLLEMCRDLLYSVGGGQPVSKRDPGDGIRHPADDGRCGGTCRKRNCRGDRGGKEKLCGRMSGKSDCLDLCGGASDRDVLLYYEA